MLELKNIVYSVDKKIILNHVNIKFPKNKITVITGHNGSGKSTLIKLIMGILNQNSGDIIYNGEVINHLNITNRANLGFTLAFQQPIKFKGITVKNLLDTASLRNNHLHDACEVLSQVGLCAKDYINRELDDTLSGGELKRIELAIALSKGGDVLLFDEPEAGIDLWSFDALVQMFKNIKNKTVIIVSHQQKVLEMADRVVLLNGTSEVITGSYKQISHRIVSTPKCNKLEGVRYE